MIEKEYVDNDYLEDYASYYATSFGKYEKRCQRIHLFTSKPDFSLAQFETFDLFIESYFLDPKNINPVKLNSIYLGFIVLRLFNKYKIGRTCIVSYGNNASRFYFSTRKHSANLFGINLTLETMAFQEQDRTTTACASIATWSALQIACKLFQRKIPSPSSVTKNALSSSISTRKFPNSGLSSEQICTAITSIGLFPYKEAVKSHKILLSLIYAYGKANLPIICGMSIYRRKNGKAVKSTKFLHAVTFNGYSTLDGRKEIFSKNELRLVSSRITKLYAHDDQLCPFSRFEVIKNEYIELGNQHVKFLGTEWSNSFPSKATDENRIAVTESIFIPLHPNIRIHMLEIYGTLLQLNSFISSSSQKLSDFLKEAEWDITLQDVNKFKNDIFESSLMVTNCKKVDILKFHFPKYIWKASAIFDGTIAFDLIFDTTESKDKTGYLFFIAYIKKFTLVSNVITKFFKRNL